MLTERFVSNLAHTRVVSGGMDVPASGTIQTLTVEESDGIFPVVRKDREQFHFKDRDPHHGKEIFRCLETSGASWTVIRGAEGTEPVPHRRGFAIRQVLTSEFLQRLGAGSTTELVNAVTVCGADPTGETTSDDALAEALFSGPVYLPTGIYATRSPLNLLPGSTLISFGNAIIRPTADFMGDTAVEIIDGDGRTRIDNITLDGSELGAGSDIYGVYAETRSIEAELRSIRISGFPNSGVIVSGYGWLFDRVNCQRNFGSGFELNLDGSSVLLACRSSGNHGFGFAGGYDRRSLIGCYVSNNRLGDYQTWKE